MSDVITEIKLNKSYKMKVLMDNGLDVKCPNCNRVTQHELATADSVRCEVCKRIVKLIWVS